MIVSGPFIILDKRPYKEAGLLLRGISPDYGRISFILHGGQSLKKAAPSADIFREVEVEFEDDNNGRDIFTAVKMELLADFSAIADNQRNYRMAGKISAFLLNNIPSGDVQLHSYEALKAVFANLSGMDCGHEPWSLIQCSVVLKCAFLYENGMLPESINPQQNEFLENLVASGVDNSQLPQCSDVYWEKLNQWLNELIAFHQLKK